MEDGLEPAEAVQTAAAEHHLLTLGHWRTYLRGRLAPLTETPGSDARALLAHCLQKPPGWLLAHPEYRLTPAETQRVHQAVGRLVASEPLPYILGQWAFFGLSFHVSPEVLIPRPETELLVETALAWLADHPDRRRAIDLGTGSGCIAISLAARCPDLEMVATDISAAALATARRNAARHQVEDRIHFLSGDLWAPVQGRFDLVCANLPYIPSETLKSLRVHGREPGVALDGGEDGLDLIRRFLRAAPDFLAPGGQLLAEIEASQGPGALSLAAANFPAAQAQIISDLAGRDRLLRVKGL